MGSRTTSHAMSQTCRFQRLFKFRPVPLDDLLYCLAAALFCTMILEGLKIPAVRRIMGV